MRSIAILALLTELAVCRVAAAAPPDQAVPPADCRPAAAAAADQSVVPACQPTAPSPRLTQRRPGFWTVEEAPGENAADQQPTVLRPGGPACLRYPLPVVVRGEPLLATVVACPEADGGWQVTQYTPGFPPQVYAAPPPPPEASAAADAYAYPESYPDWADLPWFFGSVPATLATRKFHHFRQPLERRLMVKVEHRSDHGFGRGLVHDFGRGSPLAGPGFHR
jgi:hypothetical protein